MSDASPKLRFCDGKKHRGQRRSAVAREAVDFDAAAGAELRKLIGPRDPQIGARLFDARHCVAQVVVLHQGRADQRLQLFVFEDFKPFQIGEGSGLPDGERLRRAKLRGRGELGALIIWADGAAAEDQKRERANCEFSAAWNSIPWRRRGRRYDRESPAERRLAPESLSTM